MLHGAGIFTNISPKNHPNVGKYTIHGADGHCSHYTFHVNIMIFFFLLLLLRILTIIPSNVGKTMQ